MADPNDPKTDHTQNTKGTEPVRCRACDRPLKTEASIAAGVGPTCAKKIEAGAPESTPRRKGRKIRVNPNQLPLPYDMQPPSEVWLGESVEVVPEEIAPAELEESKAKTESSAPRSTIVTVEVKIVCPSQHPSVIVVITQKGGGACSGY